MFEFTLDRTSLAMSRLWELLALPFHSGRLAALNLLYRRVLHERTQKIQLHLKTFKVVSATVLDLEEHLAEMLASLHTDASRRFLLQAHQARIDCLRMELLEEVPRAAADASASQREAS